MVNALIQHLASGQAFFSGVALIGLAVLSALRLTGRRAATTRTFAACIGLILIAASSTPLPGWLNLSAGAASLAWLVVEGSSAASARRAQAWLRAAVLSAWGLGLALEIPYHVTPSVPRLGDPSVFVVGDSLSAGMGGEAETWPAMLARRQHVDVHNLALPGANVATALRDQAGKVTGPHPLVVVEIGGNDLLGATTPVAFESGLDALLARLRAGGRTVVMLELPLPPLYHRYGAAQRRQARRHGVLLVPKRVLLGVLTAPGATVDTIHLSRRGHARLAEAIWRVIRPAFGRPPPATVIGEATQQR